MSINQIIVLMLAAKRHENPRDPFMWPLMATIFWSLLMFGVVLIFFPFRPGEGTLQLIAFIIIIWQNWAFWKAYFVAKQNRE